MRVFLMAAALLATTACSAAAASLTPVSPTFQQTVLKKGATGVFVFEAEPTQLDTATSLPYSLMGTIEFACTDGNGSGKAGVLGWEAPAGPKATFGDNPYRLSAMTQVTNHQVKVTVSNTSEGGYYCLVRVSSPGAEVP